MRIQLKNLSRKDALIINAVGSSIIPRDESIPFSFEDLALDAVADEFMDSYSDGVKAGIKFILRYFNISPVFSLKFKTFLKMDGDERRRYLEGWENSRRYLKRYLFISLKAITVMFYYNNPVVKEALGFKTGCIGK